MSKKINILTIDNLVSTNPDLLSEDNVKKYLEIEKIKPQEITTIQKLCQILKENPINCKVFENYYLKSHLQIPANNQ